MNNYTSKCFKQEKKGLMSRIHLFIIIYFFTTVIKNPKTIGNCNTFEKKILFKINLKYKNNRKVGISKIKTHKKFKRMIQRRENNTKTRYTIDIRKDVWKCNKLKLCLMTF